jgi:two-component system, NarL family, sensor histidine kinase DesK
VVAVRRPGGRVGVLVAAVWLAYLIAPLKAVLAQGGWPRGVGLAALAGFAALYLVMVDVLRRVRDRAPERPPPAPARIWLGLLGMLALAALVVPGGGEPALACLVYVAATAMIALPLRQAVPAAAALIVAGAAATRLVPGWHDYGYALAALFGSVASWGIRLAADRQRRLVVAQEELADLAVATERARIAADLHDILGHSLTVVTVKAELARRLLDVDVERARAELRDLEALARDALSDVRATALGVRGISLAGEIAAARQALAAANVAAELPGAAEEVPTRWRELFAWTIREAVTNIVRHSRATSCAVRLGPASVEIVDDGVGDAGAGPNGQGLRGLRRRAEALGATLSVGRRDDQPGFRVRVEVPS